MSSSRSGKRHFSSGNDAFILLGMTLLLASMLLVVILPPVFSPDETVPLPPMNFTSGGTPNDYRFQQRLCPCKNDWPLATTERIFSNTKFKLLNHVNDPRKLSALVPFFGQFVDHEIVLSTEDKSLGTFKVRMTPYDAILRMHRTKHRVNSNGCREHTSDNTPMIDGSVLYGDSSRPSLLIQMQMRDEGGTACTLRTSPGDLLPLSEENPKEFISGDPRNTEHSVLASLHTIFMREHNRLCGVLKRDLPLWSEEERFWKVKQIVSAKLQHIVYKEWLPALFGTQSHLLNDVQTKGTGVLMSQEFSVTAYRLHTMIPDKVGSFSLPTLFFNRQLLIDNGVEPFIQGAYTEPAQKADNQVVDGLRNFLFSAGPNIIGEDLAARNIFRGREVGMATYADLCRCFGLEPLNQEMEPHIGLFAEDLVPGSSLPRTAAHIIAEQFKRMRINDPAFYDSWDGRVALGSRFYAEVLGTTLGKVIQDNTVLENVPENVFYLK